MPATPEAHLTKIQAEPDYVSNEAAIENLGTVNDITSFKYTVTFDGGVRYPIQEIKDYETEDAVYLS